MADYNDPFMRNQNASVQARPKAQGRANVLQLKLIGQSHPTGLTANLLKLFEPRRPLEFKPPPEKRKCPPYTGMAQFVSQFAEPGDPEYAPPVQEAETPVQRRARIHKLRLEKGEEKAAEELKKHDPNNDPNISGDPYKTLFVAKLSYETSESRLKREFESHGPIKRLCELKVRIVHDAISQKPKGYAFIEYMHTRDMKAAYKQADGRKIDGRRVLVDVERGRTVPNWRPRRLGGGLGTSRVGGEVASQRHSGRDQAQSGAPSRSEEPRAREDSYDREKSRERGMGRDKEREKSHERGMGRDKEREKSHERSHDKPKDRDHRDDRHHRDRDKQRDRDRGRDRDRRHDRDRGQDRHDRDRNRERDRERERRPRDRERGSERDYELGDQDRDHGRSHDRASEYDRVDSRPDRDRRDAYYQAGADDDREHGQVGPDHDHGQYDYYEHHRKRGRYDGPNDVDGYDHYPEQSRRHDQMDEDSYQYDRPSSKDLN